MIGVDFTVNLFAGVALLLLGWIAKRVTEIAKSRNERRMWRDFCNGPELNIAVTTRPGPLPRSTTRASLSEVRVVTRIIPTLASLSLRHYLIESNSANISRAGECNLLVLGGPAMNELAREALRILEPDLPTGFDINPPTITVANRRYTPEYDHENGSVRRDYGLIIRSSNPFSSDKSLRAILVMGCHGYGTAGAAQALTSEKLAGSLLSKVGRGAFAAVVAVSVTGPDFRVEIRETYALGDL